MVLQPVQRDLEGGHGGRAWSLVANWQGMLGMVEFWAGWLAGDILVEMPQLVKNKLVEMA